MRTAPHCPPLLPPRSPECGDPTFAAAAASLRPATHPGAAPCLLLVGGKDAVLAEEMVAIRSLAARRGWQAVTLCEGHASDQRSRREHLRALTDEYDRLHAQALTLDARHPPAVWVVASGYGAYLATLLSQRRAIDRMLLRSPLVYPDAGWDLPQAQLDDRRAQARSPIRFAPNDNLALCAAGQYLGQVWIVDSAAEAPARHSLHVDYFHAFSRARNRNLACLGQPPADVTHAQPGEDFCATVARWLDTPS